MLKKMVLFFIVLSNSVFAKQNYLNMAYVEVNTNHLANAACYIRTDTREPLLNIAAIFAANINGADPNHPEIYFNPQVSRLLNNTSEVQALQKKGIKVLLTLLGNHQAAGWSCMTDERAIQVFADKIVTIINAYHLDGIDIDDEYSTCETNPNSLIRLAKAIKTHPKFASRFLTKALFNDNEYFSTTYNGNKLSDFIDYGWEMSYQYQCYEDRLKDYFSMGMKKSSLFIGVDFNLPIYFLTDAARFVSEKKYAGVMGFDLKANSRPFLSQLAKIEYGTDVTIVDNCIVED